MLVAGALGHLVFAALATRSSAPMLYALYVWCGLVTTLLVVQFWLLLGSAFGFIVMLLNWIAPEKLFNFLMNSSGALMMFTYTFVALAHYRFPYSRPELRTAGGARWIAGGAALAMLAVMVAMGFMPNKQPEMQASLACLLVIVLALFVKRGVVPGTNSRN